MNEIKTQNQIGIKGAYAYQVIDDSTGEMVIDVPEQTNLILDSYLDMGRFAPAGTYLCLGSGVVTPPSVSDTDLGNQIKVQSISMNSNSDVEDHQDYKIVKRYGSCDFTGFSGEAITELGIRKDNNNGVLVTRALIKDSEGVPTQITVNAGQTLRITYAIYFKLPKIVSSGVTPTPHGDLHWCLAADESLANWGYYLAGLKFDLETGFNQFGLFGRGLATATIAWDIPNRTVTLTAKTPAQSSVTTSQPGSPIWVPRYASIYKMIIPIGGAQYTIPANYDLTISWEITWGRLP
ncbi:MAG: hypothetical protein COB09_08105 [Thalassobium sp.]|nr:MAG: hypothetical protein COB09_08105 [Thalassobium sp.]